MVVSYHPQQPFHFVHRLFFRHYKPNNIPCVRQKCGVKLLLKYVTLLTFWNWTDPTFLIYCNGLMQHLWIYHDNMNTTARDTNTYRNCLSTNRQLFSIRSIYPHIYFSILTLCVFHFATLSLAGKRYEKKKTTYRKTHIVY